MDEHQSGSCMEANCLEFCGLNAPDTAATNHPEKNKTDASAPPSSAGVGSPKTRPLPRLVDWPPFALEIVGFFVL